MRVSVVIAAKNSADALADLLGQLSRQEVSEVVVSDGGSTDRTIAVARQNGADCTRIPDAPLGGLLNAGTRLASSDILWYLKAESRIPNDAATRILDLLEGDDRLAGGTFQARSSGGGNGLLARMRSLFRALQPQKDGVDNGLFVLRSIVYEIGGFQQTEDAVQQMIATIRKEKMGRMGVIRKPILTRPREKID